MKETLPGYGGYRDRYWVQRDNADFVLLRVERQQDPTWLNHVFSEESRILKQIRHIALPTCQECFRDEDGYYFVFELSQGYSVRQWFDRQEGRVSVESIRHWATQLADALVLLHSFRPFPLIHGDINPHSAIITASGDLRLVDFGIPLTQRAASRPSSGSPVAPATDLWKFGRLLKLMLGTPGGAGADELQTSDQQSPGGDPVRAVLDLLAARCAKDAAQPVQSFTDVSAALAELTQDLHLATADLACQCGRANRGSARFCARCGQSLHPAGQNVSDAESAVVALDDAVQVRLVDDFRSRHFAPLPNFLTHKALDELQSDPGFDSLVCLDGLSEIDKLPHQQEAALRVLRHMRGRGLLADEVGLGKTIEAGFIIKELLQRRLIESVLVLCPPSPSLLSQWQAELSEKFAETFLVFRMNIDTSLAWYCPRLIAPYSVLEQRFHADVLLSQQFDLVVLDEAHFLNEQKNAKILKVIQNLRKKYFLLLSATPMHNDVRELYNIVSLLRPGHFPAWDEFEREYVDASSSTGLKQENIARLKDVLQHVMVRNRRREVMERYETSGSRKFRFPERSAQRITLNAQEHAAEAYEFYSEIRRYFQQNLKDSSNHSFVYSRMGELVERLTSSPKAFVEGVNQSARAIERQLGPAFRSQIERFALSPMLARLVAPKMEAAFAIAVQMAKAGHKILVFSQFNETAKYAYSDFKRRGATLENPLSLYLYDEDRGFLENQSALQGFAEDRSGVLFCPGELSEGVNLQIANVMINLDLPWDPMKIEQRIGRIQRLSSRFEKVQIFNLVLAGTIEDDILLLLEQKLRMFEAVVGQVEEIVGNLSDGDDYRKMLYNLYMDERAENKEGQMVAPLDYIKTAIDEASQAATETSLMNELGTLTQSEIEELEGW